MDFRKRIIQELKLSELQAETLLNDYVVVCEKLAKEYHAEQLNIGGVSGSLLEIDLIDWDNTCGDGCCYTYGQDITLNGVKLDEQNAEDSKNALTAVLNKLGFKVEINFR